MFWTENPPNYKLEHLIPTSLLNRTENPLGPREAVLLSGFDDVAVVRRQQGWLAVSTQRAAENFPYSRDSDDSEFLLYLSSGRPRAEDDGDSEKQRQHQQL
jgi:hypothetical protein